MEKLNALSIKGDGKIFLDGVELRGVKKYKLASSAEGLTELTVEMDVRIGQAASEPGK